MNKTHQLVACMGDGWPAYWQPDGSVGRRGFIANPGEPIWETLRAVIQPVPGSSAITRATWKTVAQELAPLLEAEGFEYESDLTLWYGRLPASFRREVVGGTQKIRWSLAPGKSDQQQSSALQPLDLLMNIRMSMDVMPAANEALDINNIGDKNNIFDHGLNNLSTDPFPDFAQVEVPGALQQIADLLNTRLLPFLNKCSTPQGALDALKERGWIARESEMKWVLPRLALAWHVQDTEHYEKLKNLFLSNMKMAFSSDEEKDELMLFIKGLGRLEKMPPAYVRPSAV
jgi:hypothetical protein